jgi:hypothetical protein
LGPTAGTDAFDRTFLGDPPRLGAWSVCLRLCCKARLSIRYGPRTRVRPLQKSR